MIVHANASCCWCHEPLVYIKSVWWCQSQPCALRQLQFATYTNDKAGRVLKYLYVPTPVQTVWHEAVYKSQYRRILAGGAAGPGKSRWMRETLYLLARQVPGLHALLLRRTYNDLDQSHLRFMATEVEQRGGVWKATDKLAVFKHKGEPDAIIRAGHLEDAGAIQNYLSAEYDVIAPDELVTFERDPMLELFTRARTTNQFMIDLRGNVAEDYDGALVVSATNPGGRGGAWVKDFYVDHAPDPDEFPDYHPEQWAFFQAFLRDNPYIKTGGYEQSLSGLREQRRRQLLDGDWSVYEGQFFSEFKPRLHVRDIGAINPEWKHFLSLDWGFNSPGVCLWWVRLPDGHFHIRAEYKFNASLNERYTIKDVAKEIVARTRTMGLKKTPICYFDPDLYKFKGQIAESPVDTFVRWGVPAAAKPEHRRVQGWQRVREMLRVAPDSVPWLTFDPSCTYGIRTFPMVLQDKHDPEDVQDGYDDHWVDALRFGAVGNVSFNTSKPSIDATPAYMTTAWWRAQGTPTVRARLGSESVGHAAR